MRYSYNDKIFRSNSIRENLKADTGNSLLRIFRIISGTVECSDQFTNNTYKFKYNYTCFPFQENQQLNQKTVLSNFPDEVKIGDLDNYFKILRNKKFYDSIEVELIKCLIAKNDKKHLESFFYLYRLIEGISYSIPLIYISKNQDYNKTYNAMKSFFDLKKDGGELAFFKKFISDTFKDEDFFKSTFTIDLNTIPFEEIRTKYYEIYYKYIEDKHIIDCVADETIEVKFINYYDFLITLRNRFFHNLKGSWKENLESTELLYPDLFFKPLLDNGINLVSIIIFEVIKNEFTNN